MSDLTLKELTKLAKRLGLKRLKTPEYEIEFWVPQLPKPRGRAAQMSSKGLIPGTNLAHTPTEDEFLFMSAGETWGPSIPDGPPAPSSIENGSG
jgi:hypothetical protein